MRWSAILRCDFAILWKPFPGVLYFWGMDAAVAEKMHEIAAICRKRYVAAIAVFGSVLGDSFTEASDIDFVVTFNDVPLLKYADNFFDLKADLEKLFNRPVDLITSTSLQNPVLIREIERTKQVVYAA